MSYEEGRVTAWRSSKGVVKKDPLQWPSEVRRAGSTRPRPRRRALGEGSRLLCDGRRALVSSRRHPNCRIIGAPRWPRYIRHGEGPCTLRDPPPPPRGLAIAFGGGRTPPPPEKPGNGQDVVHWPALPMRRGGGHSQDWCPNKEWTPDAQRNGKMLGQDQPLCPYCGGITQKPRIKGWVIWNDTKRQCWVLGGMEAPESPQEAPLNPKAPQLLLMNRFPVLTMEGQTTELEPCMPRSTSHSGRGDPSWIQIGPMGES